MREQCSALKRKRRGVTLIELMVALAIGLIVLFAVTSVFVSTKANARLQAGVARANEAAQASTELLARDIRQLGSAGCPNVARITISKDSPQSAGVATISIDSNTSTQALRAGTAGTPTDAAAGSTVLEVMHAAEGGAQVAAATADRANPLIVTSDPGFATITAPNYPLAIVSGCTYGEVFRIARIQTNPWRVDPFEPLRARYGSDTRVAPVTRTQYFLAPATRAADERSTQAIFVRRASKNGLNWESPQPLIHDVTSMQVIVHSDTDGDFQGDTTSPFTPGVDVTRIVGYTLELVLNAPQGSTAGAVITRPIKTTINVRNRVI